MMPAFPSPHPISSLCSGSHRCFSCFLGPTSTTAGFHTALTCTPQVAELEEKLAESQQANDALGLDLQRERRLTAMTIEGLQTGRIDALGE